MKKSRLPTNQEIDDLTTYLPKLYAEGFSPIVDWGGGEKRAEGSITVPYPNYHNTTEEFFRLAARECWLDYEYIPEDAGRMLRDEDFIRSASLDQVKTMLTFCLRGERFSDGHWGEMIEGGQIRRLLKRLMVIRSERPN